MNRQKGLSILLVFSLAFNIAFAGIWLYHFLYVRPMLAERRERRTGPEPPEALALARLERLHLRPGQQAQIQALRRGMREGLGRELRDTAEAREQFLILLQDPAVPSERLRASEKEVAVHQEKVRRIVLNHLLAVRDVLDQDQRRELGRALRRHPGPRAEDALRPRRMGPLRRQEDRQNMVVPEDNGF